MWFKNLQVYSLKSKETYTAEEFEAKLTPFKFVNCGKHDFSKTGWSNVLDFEDGLSKSIGKCIFIRHRTEEKIIPASTLKERCEARIQQYKEDNAGEKPNAKQKDDFKTAIRLEMAATAFTKSSYVDAYIDFENKLVIVNSGSAKKSEDLLGLLRSSLGSLEAPIIEPSSQPKDRMSDWLNRQVPPNKFEFGINCDLKDDNNGGSVNIKKQELDNDEVKVHLTNKKEVKKLELVWAKRIRFSLTEKFEIKSIKPESICIDDLKDDLGDSKDKWNEYQSTMTMMTGDFAEMLTDLGEVL